MSRVDKTEAYLNTLPTPHQQMMCKYRDHLHRIRYCIDENFQIIRKLIEDVDNLFENANQSVIANSQENGYSDVRLQDLDKVSVRDVREWVGGSCDGDATCYEMISLGRRFK